MALDLGYWTPVYGGFLRNVREEGRMAATWEYIREVSTKADRLGFHTTLVPELYLNDRKGTDAPSLEAWSLSAAILGVTERLRVMTAVRPERSKMLIGFSFGVFPFGPARVKPCIERSPDVQGQPWTRRSGKSNMDRDSRSGLPRGGIARKHKS